MRGSISWPVRVRNNRQWIRLICFLGRVRAKSYCTSIEHQHRAPASSTSGSLQHSEYTLPILAEFYIDLYYLSPARYLYHWQSISRKIVTGYVADVLHTACSNSTMGDKQPSSLSSLTVPLSLSPLPPLSLPSPSLSPSPPLPTTHCFASSLPPPPYFSPPSGVGLLAKKIR